MDNENIIQDIVFKKIFFKSIYFRETIGAKAEIETPIPFWASFEILMFRTIILNAHSLE